MSCQKAMDWTDIQNAIWEKGQSEELRDDKENMVASQLLKFSVKYGVARLEHHFDSMRSLNNQHRTGTVIW